MTYTIDVARLITPLSPIQKEILQILWENHHGDHCGDYESKYENAKVLDQELNGQVRL